MANLRSNHEACRKQADPYNVFGKLLITYIIIYNYLVLKSSFLYKLIWILK